MAQPGSIFSGEPQAQESIFNKKLLLSTTSIMKNPSISNENYTFDEADTHHKNVYHGKMFGCPDEKVLVDNPVSCMLFSECVEALKMKTHLETLDDAVGMAGSVVKTYGVVHVKPKETPMQFGSLTLKEAKDEIILVTGKISTITFNDWLKARTRPENTLMLFRDLFYIVKKIHRNNMFCGNVRDGIRISGNKPMLVYPARSEVIELDGGIWSDLRELYKMVQDSMPHTTAEWILFKELCDEYAPEKIDNVSKLKYKGAQLRDGSFLILSSSIIWNSAERYDFVRKCGEYRSLDIYIYEKLIRDNSILGRAIPNIDWYKRLKNAAQGSDEFFIYVVYQHNYTEGKIFFTSSESIRYFERCVYEHLERSYKDYTDVSDLLYRVFPEAPSALYRMMIHRLYRQTTIRKNPLPSVIDFFWKDPHCFNKK